MAPPSIPVVESTAPRRKLRADELAALEACAAELKHSKDGTLRFSEGVLPISAEAMRLFYLDNSDGQGERPQYIKFPPSKEELANLHQAALESPFGVGHQTVYDASYRIAKEFKTDRFAINFEPLSLGNILSTIELESNTTSPLRAELYKLNLYGVGGFFKSHCDTPKSNEHIGTLLVCLPTDFDGGEFVLRDDPPDEHGQSSPVLSHIRNSCWSNSFFPPLQAKQGDEETEQKRARTSAHQVQEVKFDWSAAAKDGKASWLFFYSDCNHAVLPVTSGTRLTLSYDIYTSSRIPSAAVSTYANHPLYEHLKRLVESPSFLPEGGRVAIGLQHGYPTGEGLEEKFESEFDEDRDERLTRYYDALPSFLKGVDREVYGIVKGLGIPVEFRAVFECSDVEADDTKEEDGDDSDSDGYDGTENEDGEFNASNLPRDKFSTRRISERGYTSVLLTSVNFSGQPVGGEWNDTEDSDYQRLKKAGAVGERDLVWLKVPETYIKVHSFATMGNEVSYSATGVISQLVGGTAPRVSSASKLEAGPLRWILLSTLFHAMSKADYAPLPLDEPQGPPAYGSDTFSEVEFTSVTSSTVSSDTTVTSQPATTTPLPRLDLGHGLGSNQFSVVRKKGGITGSYALDTSRNVPAMGLSPSAEDGDNPLAALAETLAGLGEALMKRLPGFEGSRAKKFAAFLATREGEIDVQLSVKGGGRAVIGVENCGKGTRGVKLAISSRAPDTLLDLTISSSTRIHVSLPSDFRGLVKGGTEHGSVEFSPALTSRVATFSVNQQSPTHGRYFIGDWMPEEPSIGDSRQLQSSSTSLVKWEGDVLSVACQGKKSREIYIETWEEREERREAEERRKAEWKDGFGGWLERVSKSAEQCFKSFFRLMGACGGCK
ncbi:hypothetical protein MNV49_005654 [Pseudohyphozyma bogoriensis]|nr:hypothetical protein MNV49_005654 [Pseudohyphozyma bogoriensis]